MSGDVKARAFNTEWLEVESSSSGSFIWLLLIGLASGSHVEEAFAGSGGHSGLLRFLPSLYHLLTELSHVIIAGWDSGLRRKTSSGMPGETRLRCINKQPRS